MATFAKEYKNIVLINKYMSKQIDIEALYTLFTRYPKVSIDSRNCPQGSIFFALKGPNFDGNKYAVQALQSGAAFAVVDDAEAVVSDRYFLVENVLDTLQKLAHFHRTTLGIPIVAITGTNGKTTTKELVSAVLSTTYNTAFTQGNLNNHIGVPLTLLSMNSQHEIGVVEMGANHVGEIAELAQIAQPNIGIITNIGKAHIEGFGSSGNIIRAKSELYQNIARQPKGKLFVCADDNLLLDISENIPRFLYGKSAKANLQGEVISDNSTPLLKVKYFWKNTTHEVQTQLIGSYNLSNVLAAVSIGLNFGVNLENIDKALSMYTPKNYRSQYLETPLQNKVIIDAYNANPSSMKEAIDNMEQMTALQKTVILGNMMELGSCSQEEHQLLVHRLVEGNYQHLFLVGKLFASFQDRSIYCFDNVEGLCEYLKSNPIRNNLVLVKGSRSVALEKVIPFL